MRDNAFLDTFNGPRSDDDYARTVNAWGRQLRGCDYLPASASMSQVVEK
jgi:hypothetical protein